jgi:chaperone modulatory protein CbpM
MTLRTVHIERWVARGLVRGLEPIDQARLRLLNELADDIGLDDDTVEAVVGLIDQIHTLRSEVRLLAAAIAEQPPATREAIAAALKRLGGG